MEALGPLLGFAFCPCTNRIDAMIDEVDSDDLEVSGSRRITVLLYPSFKREKLAICV